MKLAKCVYRHFILAIFLPCFRGDRRFPDLDKAWWPDTGPRLGHGDVLREERAGQAKEVMD